jgi:hypothetical protein
MKKLGGCTTKKDGVVRYKIKAQGVGVEVELEGGCEKEISQIVRQIGPDNTG